MFNFTFLYESRKNIYECIFKLKSKWFNLSIFCTGKPNFVLVVNKQISFDAVPLALWFIFQDVLSQMMCYCL